MCGDLPGSGAYLDHTVCTCMCALIIVFWIWPQKTTSSKPTLYTNRALCCLKLENWSQVVQDCEKAVQLDPSSIKAHFYKGQALIELGKYDGAIVSLKKGACMNTIKVVIISHSLFLTYNSHIILLYYSIAILIFLPRAHVQGVK